MTIEETETLLNDFDGIFTDNNDEGNIFNVYVKHRTLTTTEAARNYLVKLNSYVKNTSGGVELVGAHVFDTYTYYTVKISFGEYTGIKNKSAESITGFNNTKMLVKHFSEYYPVLSAEPSEPEKQFAAEIVNKMNTVSTPERILRAV